MNCLACSNTLPEGSAFCEFCGASLKPDSIAFPPAVGSAAVAAPAPSGSALLDRSNEPSAATLAEIGGALIKKLSLGEKLSGAGALASTVGFFLPWLSGPDLKSLGNISVFTGLAGVTTTSYSGLDVAKIWGGFYLPLAAAIASGILFFASSKATLSRKLFLSAFQVMIGSLYGPGTVLVILFVPFMQSVAGLGFWLIGLGFCSIVAGGLVSINQLVRTAR